MTAPTVPLLLLLLGLFASTAASLLLEDDYVSGFGPQCTLPSLCVQLLPPLLYTGASLLLFLSTDFRDLVFHLFDSLCDVARAKFGIDEARIRRIQLLEDLLDRERGDLAAEVALHRQDQAELEKALAQLSEVKIDRSRERGRADRLARRVSNFQIDFEAEELRGKVRDLELELHHYGRDVAKLQREIKQKDETIAARDATIQTYRRSEASSLKHSNSLSADLDKAKEEVMVERKKNWGLAKRVAVLDTLLFFLHTLASMGGECRVVAVSFALLMEDCGLKMGEYAVSSEKLYRLADCAIFGDRSAVLACNYAHCLEKIKKNVLTSFIADFFLEGAPVPRPTVDLSPARVASTFQGKFSSFVERLRAVSVAPTAQEPPSQTVSVPQVEAFRSSLPPAQSIPTPAPVPAPAPPPAPMASCPATATPYPIPAMPMFQALEKPGTFGIGQE
ncbi:hypothetical protein CC78DRAFT_599291 [Lojkania enalia]|uniref:Uncharacterized protein n=1 Tax=Lojkania enalia TaxID=147567 RepID=A0A9P4K035_9PLEO|nr:hypothetical protein CC78DRAFT_599291 [Didymosphaeria enalia]